MKKTNIKGIWGPGIIIGEEDIIFKNDKIDNFQVSSTVRCKSSEGILFVIKLNDLERETRTQVKIILMINFRKRLGSNLKDIDYWRSYS